MTSRSVVTALAAAVALLGQPAAASPPPADLWTAFQKVCVEHQGDPDGARAAALALGLSKDEAAPKRDPKGEIDESYVPSLSGPFTWAVMLSHPQLGWDAAKVTGCMIQAVDADLGLYNTLLAWPGTKGGAGDGQRMNFGYRQTAQGRSELPSDDVVPVLMAGELRGLIVQHDEAGTLILLMTFAPAK